MSCFVCIFADQLLRNAQLSHVASHRPVLDRRFSCVEELLGYRLISFAVTLIGLVSSPRFAFSELPPTYSLQQTRMLRVRTNAEGQRINEEDLSIGGNLEHAASARFQPLVNYADRNGESQH